MKQNLKFLAQDILVERYFKNEKLKKEDLDTILEIARLSPSSLGLGMKILVVQDDNKEELAQICNQQQHVKIAGR